jgi:hypothetical protein
VVEDTSLAGTLADLGFIGRLQAGVPSERSHGPGKVAHAVSGSFSVRWGSRSLVMRYTTSVVFLPFLACSSRRGPPRAPPAPPGRHRRPTGRSRRTTAPPAATAAIPTASSPASGCRRPRLLCGSGTWARRSRRYWLHTAAVMGEDGRASLGADDGERENFHRSARAPPATHGHAGHITPHHDTAGHTLTSRLCRVPGPGADACQY